MGKLKPLGLLIGLAGNLAVGLALYHLLETGSCGGYGHPACPDDLTPWVIALPVGLVTSTIAIFLGGGAYAFTGVFLAVGLGSMASSAFGTAADDTFGWVFGGLFTLFGAVPLALYLTAKPVVVRRRAVVQAPRWEPATRPDPVPDTAGQLTKLNDLRLSGALTDAEFAVAKDRVLGVSP